MSGTNVANLPRVDAREKVLGATRFAADVAPNRIAHAMTVPSSLPKGRLISIDTAAARALPGVLAVLTHSDLTGVKSAGYLADGGYGFQSHQPMLSDRIVHRGEAIALVVAESLPIAIHAASLVVATYEAEPFTAMMDSPGADVQAFPSGVSIGDAGAALAGAAYTIDAEYFHPAQHQNPMELISTTAEWRNGDLFIYEGTQNSGSLKFGVARALGMEPSRVHVSSPYLGGGFGQKNSLQSQTVLVASAALAVGRAVKLVVPRAQLFHTASFRPASRHRIRLGADADGRIVAAHYSADQQNGRQDAFNAPFGEIAARLYAIADFTAEARGIRTDTQSPGFMRAPFEHPAAFAFESAVDELAYAAGRDPLAFRLANDAVSDPVTGRPFSSRHLAGCLQIGAERFGWEARQPEPRSMRAPDGTQLGLGVACGAYKASISPAIARLRVGANGTTRLSLSGHEMGQGIRTAITAALLSRLDIDPDGLSVTIGDPDAAPQHVTAGSWGTASAVPVVDLAVDRFLAAFDELRGESTVGGNLHQALQRLRRPYIEVEARHRAPGQPEVIFDRLRQGLPGAGGPDYPDFVSFSYIAHFVEVHVEAVTRRIRVPRVMSVVDCGTVMNRRTARSQMLGGVVWGIGAALREAAEIDPRYGGALNNDLAEYLVPVNADIGDIQVEFIDQPDTRLNRSGVKGLGEVAMVGVAAAIANAVFHATGIRVRDLPIRIEHLL